MPTVAIVEGVKIQFYAREHPPPHFHVVFAEYRAQFEIASLRILKGDLPRAKRDAVLAWASTRRAALLQAWELALANRPPEKIE